MMYCIIMLLQMLLFITWAAPMGWGRRDVSIRLITDTVGLHSD